MIDLEEVTKIVNELNDIRNEKKDSPSTKG